MAFLFGPFVPRYSSPLLGFHLSVLNQVHPPTRRRLPRGDLDGDDELVSEYLSVYHRNSRPDVIKLHHFMTTTEPLSDGSCAFLLRPF